MSATPPNSTARGPEPLPLFHLPAVEPCAAGSALAPVADDVAWHELVRSVVARLAATHDPFQFYDLHERHGVPAPLSHYAWGHAAQRAHRAGLIECIGAVPSRRRTTCGSLTKLWRGAQWAPPTVGGVA